MGKSEAELGFWSFYANHLCEQDKQIYCTKFMGIEFTNYIYDLKNKSILEIGAGPVGLSLHCINGRRKVIDPGEYPNWVWERYTYFGIETDKCRVEDMNEVDWDEVWVLNVLQHVDDLSLAIKNIKKSAKILRIFDWLNIQSDDLHPQLLTKEVLDAEFGIIGEITIIRQSFTYQTEAYYGCYNLSNGQKVLRIPDDKFWANLQEKRDVRMLRG